MCPPQKQIIQKVIPYALCPAECFKIPWYFQEEG